MAEIKITVDIPEELIQRITDALRPNIVNTIASEQQVVKAEKPKVTEEPVKEEQVQKVETPVVQEEPVKEETKPAISRAELKKFMMTRYAEGVNVAEIIRTVGKADKFSAIDDGLIEAVYEAVKNA